MQNIIYSVKNVVFIIVVAEFLKNFLVSDRYKKYVSVSINILVVAFLIMQLKGMTFKLDEFDVSSHTEEYSNRIQTEYEKNVVLNLKEEYEKNNISVNNIIIETDEKYNILTLEIHPENISDYDNIKNITEGLGIYNYEIIENYK